MKDYNVPTKSINAVITLELHNKMKARAAAKGMLVKDYLAGLIEEDLKKNE